MSTNAAVSRVEITGPGRNLLNPEVMAKLEADLRAAGDDPNTTGIILTGAGDVFCGGLDVPAIQAGADPIPFYSALISILKLIPELPKPVLALVNGDAVASGGAFVAVSDYAVSVPDAKIGSYEVSVGVWPIVAQVPLIKRLGARAAIQNIASGEPFTAEQALNVGLVNEVGGADQVEALANEWLTKAARAGKTMTSGRPSVYQLEQLNLNDGLDAAFKLLSQAYDN
ncbi:MAG: enoyl-CoA hydratase/isomerase family protein [Leucobacter sp.]|nr:enoyl-CoA hydratase/isomerase family protein [Leucobacter sp.]